VRSTYCVAVGGLATFLANHELRAAGDVATYAPFALGLGFAAGVFVPWLFARLVVLVVGFIAWWVVLPDGPECDPGAVDCDSLVIVFFAAVLVLGCWVFGLMAGALTGWFIRR
jgi:hypothetical protein